MPPTLPPSLVSGGLFGDTPGERSQRDAPFAIWESKMWLWGSHAGAAGAACGRRGPMGPQAWTWALVSPHTDCTGPSEVGGEDSQDRRRAALLTVLIQVQVVTWKDRRCHQHWQDLWDRVRARTCPPGLRTLPPPAAAPAAMAMLRQSGAEPHWDGVTKVLPSSSRSPYSVSPHPAARRHGVPGLHSQGQPQRPASFGARAGVVPAHWGPLLLAGRAEPSGGGRAEGSSRLQALPQSLQRGQSSF